MSEIGRISIERFQKECVRTEATNNPAESSLAAPAGSVLHRTLSEHVGHVGLHLDAEPNGTVVLKCFARTHGGTDVILMIVPNDRA